MLATVDIAAAPAARCRDCLRKSLITLPLSQGSGSLRLDVGCPDHLAPLFGVICNELAEIGRRPNEGRAAQVSEACLQSRVAEGCVYFAVELIGDLDRRVLRR